MTTVALILALIPGATALIGLLGAYLGAARAPLVGFMLFAAGTLLGGSRP